MNPPYELILFGVAFCSFAIIVCTVRAHLEKEKSHYFGAMISFLMLLVFVFIFLDQRLLVIIFFSSAGILGIATLPKLTKFLERKSVKLAQEVDLSSPFRGRDLLTNKGLLKLAYRCGVWKTVSIYSLFSAVAIGGVLYILSTYGIVSTSYLVGYTISYAILSTIMLYHQISKALSPDKPK